MTGPPSERRAYARWAAAETAEIEIGGATLACQVVNLSAGGAQLRCLGSYGLMPGDRPQLRLRGLPPIRAEVVWIREELVGLKFRDGPQYIFR